MFRTAPLLCLALLACSPLPDLGPAARSEAGAWPVLVPFETLTADLPSDDLPDLQAGLSSRAAALRARAALIRAMPL